MLPVCCNRGIDKVGGSLFELVSPVKPFVAVIAVDVSVQIKDDRPVASFALSEARRQQIR